MNQNQSSSSNPLIWFAIAALGVLFLYSIVSLFSPVDSELKNALKIYQSGEQATTLAARQDAFNKSLTTYLQLTKQYDPTYGDGKIYYNIANTYFQLEQYPLAVLYYYRALNLRPRDDNTRHNLAIAKDKLGIKTVESQSVFDKIFYFQNYWSIPERLQVVLGLIILLFLVGSAWIWTQFKALKALIGLVALALLVMLGSLFYTQFMSPSEAVVINATTLFRDAGDQYAKVSEKPVPAGTKVEVLNVLRGGKWLKVVTPDGMLGFAPNDSLRLL